MGQFNFGGVMEEVITDDEFPLQKAREILKDEIVAVLGLSLIHISEPTRPAPLSRMPSSA